MLRRPHSEWRNMPPRKPPPEVDHFYWPDSLRKTLKKIVKVSRDVAVGIDTWSAIKHGIIPLDDRSGSAHSYQSPDDPRRRSQ